MSMQFSSILPLDSDISAVIVGNDKNGGLECVYQNRLVFVPNSQLSWFGHNDKRNQFIINDILNIRLIEYNYRSGSYVASHRITHQNNPFLELLRFPIESIFSVRVAEINDFPQNIYVRMPNGILGILDRHSFALKDGLKIGAKIDVYITFLLITPLEAYLYLRGVWTNEKVVCSWQRYDSFEKYFPNSYKYLLELGNCVCATLVQKEPYGLYYEYLSHRILVKITHLTWDSSKAMDFIKNACIGSTNRIKILGFDFEKRIYEGTMIHIEHEGPYWELTYDSPSTVYWGTIYQIGIDDICVRLPNGAFGYISKKFIASPTFAKGDNIEVIINSLTPLSLSPYQLTLKTPNFTG